MILRAAISKVERALVVIKLQQETAIEEEEEDILLFDKFAFASKNILGCS